MHRHGKLPPAPTWALLLSLTGTTCATELATDISDPHHYLYVGTSSSGDLLWMDVVMDKGGRVPGSKEGFAWGQFTPASGTVVEKLEGTIGDGGNFVLDTEVTENGERSHAPGTARFRLEGRFTPDFRNGSGTWIDIGKRRESVALHRVAHYLREEVSVTREEDCSGIPIGECACHNVDTSGMCRYNNGSLSVYPVWEVAPYTRLNAAFQPKLDAVRRQWGLDEPGQVAVDPDAFVLESHYLQLDLVYLSPMLVSYHLTTTDSYDGAAHPSNYHEIGSLAADGGGNFAAIGLENVLALDARCRTALQTALVSRAKEDEDLDGQKQERYAQGYASLAVVPGGLYFLYNLDQASGGRTLFLPTDALPQGCVSIPEPMRRSGEPALP